MAYKAPSATPQPPVFHYGTVEGNEDEKKQLTDGDKLKVAQMALQAETKESCFWKEKYEIEQKYRILEKSVLSFKISHLEGGKVLDTCKVCGLLRCPDSGEHTEDMTQTMKDIDEDYLTDLFKGWCPSNFMLPNGKYKCLPKW